MRLSDNVYGEVYKIMEDYDLLDQLHYFMHYNESNNLPYHNMYHSFCVVQTCHELATESMNFRQCDYVLCGIHEPPVILNHMNVRDLLTAALFHDFNHSGGLMDDKGNVRIAIDYAPKRWMTDTVKWIIRATQYPYVIVLDKLDTPLKYMQAIIRDADLVRFTRENSICQGIYGLYSEMVKGNTKLTFPEFIIGSKKFINDAEFLVYSNSAMKSIKQSYLDLLNKLQEGERKLVLGNK